MELKDQFKQDIIAAMKSGDKLKLTVLRTVTGVIQSAEKAGKTETTFNNEEVERVIAREVKKRLTTADEYRKAGVEDRALLEEAEAKILQQYLPEQLTVQQTEELLAMILTNFPEPTRKDMGNIMQEIKNTTQDMNKSVDRRLVGELLQKVLN